MKRLIGDLGDHKSNKLLLAIGAIHGNEPEGMEALQKVVHHLKTHDIRLNGRFVALVGNVKAVSEKKRYIDTDLNRIWSEENAQLVASGKVPAAHEYQELKELLAEIEKRNLSAYEKKTFLDLHGTSGANGIFVIIQRETLPEESHLANFLTAPKLLGLHKELHQTTIPFMNHRGFRAIGFEGGQIGDPQSVINHEYILWETLLFKEFISEADVPVHIKNYDVLKGFSSMLPTYLQVEYCHKIGPDDRFKMLPGFKNFDAVTIGDALATDKNGIIRALESGYILMPLYQATGSDGFFLIKKADGVESYSPKRDESYWR